jgi:hypothetical protein
VLALTEMDAIETLRLADGTRIVTIAGKDSDYRSCRHACCPPAGDRTADLTLMDYHLSIYEQAEDAAWGAHSPDVDGVFALGQTRQEAESRMADPRPAYRSRADRRLASA